MIASTADHASGTTGRILQLQAALDVHGVLARNRDPAERVAPAAALALRRPAEGASSFDAIAVSQSFDQGRDESAKKASASWRPSAVSWCATS
mgnify:CR=1 FL=1